MRNDSNFLVRSFFPGFLTFFGFSIVRVRDCLSSCLSVCPSSAVGSVGYVALSGGHRLLYSRRVDYSFLPSSKNFPLQSADKSYLLKNIKQKTKTSRKKQSSVKNNTFYSLYLRQTINWWKGMRLDFISSGKKSKSVFDFLTYSRETGFSFSYAEI